MATRTFDEIIQSFITFLIRRNDLIDVKPTAITRTLLDSIANELAVVNAEIENVRRIQTILNFAEMTEEELDNYAANFGVRRREASFATTVLSFYVPVEPRDDITILQGTLVATSPDATISGSVQFQTLETATMFANRINSYFNVDTGFYEVNVRARAVLPGTAGNVPARSISRVVNSPSNETEFVFVTNKTSGIGGADIESNADFAPRILISISGLNVGTKDGYKSSVLELQGVEDAIVVGAGDPMMFRDYNSLGQHIGGRVDVYIQGEDPAESQQRVLFEFQRKRNQRINLIQGSVLEFNVPDPELETYPLVSIDRVYTRIKNPILQFEEQLPQFQRDPNFSDEICVVIVSPLSGSIVDGGIDVLVRAFKPNGQIKRVNLIVNKESTLKMIYDNNQGLYKFTLNTTSFRDGLIQLEAQAFDEFNKNAKTRPVMVTVRNLKDVSVRILSPEAGSTIRNTSDILVFAFSKAGIAPRGVEIRLNNGPFITMRRDSVANRYRTTLTPSNFRSGPIKIEARAKDSLQRVADAVPRYVVIDNDPEQSVNTNEVHTLAIHTVQATHGGLISRSPINPGTQGTSIVNEIRAGGNFNVARLLNPSSINFSESDIEHKKILPNRNLAIMVNKVAFENDGEWAGTDIGLFFSPDNAESFPYRLWSGEAVGLSEKDDRIRSIEKNQEYTYVGSDGGVLFTKDRETYHRITTGATTSILSMGFMKLP